MKMMGLNRKKYSFKGGKGELSYDSQTSKLHSLCKKSLKELFPATFISEEVTIQIDDYKYLFLDFFIPTFRTAIEVHGQQHFKYNPHFYSSRNDFVNAKQRDEFKRDWCTINQVNFIELLYNESIDDWKRKIRESIG